MRVSEELQYLLVVVGLFVVPRVLQRFRIPSAITCVALGAGLGMGAGLFRADSTVPMLATLGIVSLFLFAGLEVDFGELRRGAWVTAGYLGLQLALLAGTAWLSARVFELQWRPALLIALALLTPSTGFILDSLAAFGLDAEQRFWVKTKAVASELVALAALFVTVQSGSAVALAASTGALVAMIAILPFVFRVFVARILPFAPNSEFAFLLILALICAYTTRHLGVYYLVGAFVVGVTAVRLRQQLPALASERLLIAIELFASFFIPFYFFKAGLHLEREFFGLDAVGLGLLFVVLTIPLRVGTTALFRRIALAEPFREGGRVALSLVPTLVFTIVLADILHERYALPDHLYGALLVFALTNTTLPGFVLRAAPEFDRPEAPRSIPPGAALLGAPVESSEPSTAVPQTPAARET